MKRVVAVLLVGCSVALAACGGGAGEPDAGSAPVAAAASEPAKAPAGGASVTIEGFAFGPRTLKAKVGEKITWTNDDAAAHTVTAKPGGDFDSGTLAQGASFSFTPQKVGTIAYFCAIHPSMTATIEVS